VKKLEIDDKSSFIKIEENMITTIESKSVKISNDDGKTSLNQVFLCESISDKEPIISDKKNKPYRSSLLILLFYIFSFLYLNLKILKQIYLVLPYSR